MINLLSKRKTRQPNNFSVLPIISSLMYDEVTEEILVSSAENNTNVLVKMMVYFHPNIEVKDHPQLFDETFCQTVYSCEEFNTFMDILYNTARNHETSPETLRFLTTMDFDKSNSAHTQIEKISKIYEFMYYNPNVEPELIDFIWDYSFSIKGLDKSPYFKYLIFTEVKNNILMSGNVRPPELFKSFFKRIPVNNINIPTMIEILQDYKIITSQEDEQFLANFCQSSGRDSGYQNSSLIQQVEYVEWCLRNNISPYESEQEKYYQLPLEILESM